MNHACDFREMKDREQQIIRLQAARLDLMRDALRKQVTHPVLITAQS